jgi:hypothetical protein
MFGVEEDAIPIFPITIFQNDVLYKGVTMYLYCGEKVYIEDTLRINGMIVGRKELTEYKLNSAYSSHKKTYECSTPYLHTTVMMSLIRYVTRYFATREYSHSNVEKLQLKVLNGLEEFSGVLVSPYVIRDMCRFYRII